MDNQKAILKTELIKKIEDTELDSIVMNVMLPNQYYIDNAIRVISIKD
tara:strand:- start:205 stop:348 length:144 start_codon:yes stop_codon:yes gene_type:complete